MLVYLKGCYTILGKIKSNSKENRIQFTVPFKDKPDVTVNIILDENSVESFHEFKVSKEMWEALQNETPARDLPA